MFTSITVRVDANSDAEKLDKSIKFSRLSPGVQPLMLQQMCTMA